ncbi:MAG: histone deacetylase [Actinomycetota bacterium]|nr:histone deacetylase [Actinomycetota bacterium]
MKGLRPVTLLYTHPSSYEHETGTHPENAGRIRAIEKAIEEASPPGLEPTEAPRATREQLARAHEEAHLDAVESFCAAGGGMIDLDTVASRGSWEAAARAAGAACDAAERLLAGEDTTAFCALRPPGHHAEPAKAMGFCLLNQVAVAAEHARAHGAERVLIFDWDVHHGNGTEEIFKGSPDVLYASIHGWPLYPGTGDIGYTGEGAGAGYTVNMPVPNGSGDELFTALTEHVVAPIARAFEPGLIAISAGFDAHRDDPLASCDMTAAGFRAMAAQVAGVASELGVPVLVCLEGGYDPGALGQSVVAMLAGLADGTTDGGSDRALTEPYRERFAANWLV